MARKIITGATLAFGKKITIVGQTVDVDEMSLKCGVKAIDEFSLRRLTNCHAAVVMKLPKSGVSFIRFEVAPDDPRILKAGGLNCARCTWPKTGRRFGT